MMVRKLFFFAIILMIASSAAAQTDPDATVKAFKAALLDFYNNKQGRVDQTERLSDDLYNKFKKDPKVLVGIADAYSTIKDTTYSYKFYNYAIALDPANMEPYVEAGKWEEADSTKQSYERALAWYNRAIKANPKDSTGYVRAARLLAMRLGKWDEAVAKLNEISAFNKDYPVNLNIARMYDETNRWGKAIEYFSKEDFNRFEPYDLTAYATECLLTKGFFEQGVPVVEFGIKKYPNHAQLWRIARKYAIGQKKYKEASEYGEAFFANRNENIKIVDYDYMELAEAYQQQHKTNKAIEVYEKVISIDSIAEGTRNNSYRQIASIYKDLGDWDKAYATYERLFAVEMAENKPNPKDFETYAMMYEEQAEELMSEEEKHDAYRKAIQAWDRLSQVSENYADYALYKAIQCCYKIDNILKSDTHVSYAERLIAMLGQKAEVTSREMAILGYAWFSLAYHHFQNENWSTAYEYAENTLKCNPDNDTAKRIMESSKKYMKRRR